MRTTVTPQAEPAAGTLWRCGGRDCGAGECEHEENELHRHASGPGPQYAPGIVHEVVRSSGAPLPVGVREEMESRLGHDFADVRIHTDARAGESARQVEALAYTVGRHVVFAPGQFNPGSGPGQRLIAHELTHAAESPHAATAPPGELKVSSPDDPAERAADRVAAAASAPAATSAGTSAGTSGTAPPSTLHRSSFPQTASDRYEHGGPLPYREATEFMSCMDIMNDRTYCEQEVLGIQPAPPPPPVTCVPSQALTWADFTGTPPGQSPHAARTAFSFSSVSSSGRDWIVATFDAGSSWVKQRPANPTDRSLNGCAPQVAACEQHFDTRTAQGQVGITFHLGAVQGCAASPQPDLTLNATTRAECSTVLGTECDRVAGLDSARLLHHEQLHLDLACKMADKGNAAISANPAANTQTILNAVRTKANQQTSRYDTQTNHGCIAAQQAAWDTRVANGLPGVTIP